MKFRVKNDKEENSVKEETKGMRILKEILGTGFYLLIVLIVTLLIIKFVGQRTEVSGQSMEPTLSNGDNLIVDKISYRFRAPERFEIIVFPPPHQEDTFYIKRIIGLPGEKVRIDEEGKIYINGEVLEESYGKEQIRNPGLAFDEIELEKDEYFVLGDNRNNSSDSRAPQVGNVHMSKIIGRAFIRIFPFDHFGFVGK